MAVSEKDRDILARTLYGESRGEGLAGQIAVAWTIRNRVEDGRVKSWWGDGNSASGCRRSADQSGEARVARAILNSSFISMIAIAPRTLAAVSLDLFRSARADNSRMAVSRAVWFSWILESSWGNRSRLCMDDSYFVGINVAGGEDEVGRTH